MKYSQREELNAKQAKIANVLKWNTKTLEEFTKKLKKPCPQSLIDFVNTSERRLAGIRLKTFKSFNEMFPNQTQEGTPFAVHDGKDKASFPYLYVYCPELEDVAKGLEDRNQKFHNLKRISMFIEQRYGINVAENKKFKNFILDLPADIPYKLAVDGNRARVERLGDSDGTAKLYGSCDDAIFAVQHMVGDTSTLTLFIAELENVIEEIEIKKNFSRISAFFEQRYKINVAENKKFKNFILDLPTDIPYNLTADGSRVRVTRLTTKEGSKLYGSCDDEIFAVQHMLGNTPTLTLFVESVNHVADFANRINKKLQIGDELAMKISQALPHDLYYSIPDTVETNFTKFVTRMAYLLKVEEGSRVHCYLQGDVDVVVGANSQKLALDLDDELPAAIIVGNHINLYIPDWVQVETDK